MSGFVQERRAIERELEECEGLPHYSSEYLQGAADALMWALGKTPPPSADYTD